MRLKTLLLGTALALSFTVSAPTPAKADPITAAIVSFIGFTGTAAAVATFVINSALYAGASWALGKASRALGKNKQSVQERQASVLQLTLGEVPREMVFGHTTTGGSLIDAFNHGGQYGTDYVTRVIALADHAVDALLGYYVDDQYVAFSANGTQAGFGGTLSIEFRNASGSAVSLPSVASAGGWGASDKLIGVTHVWVTYKFDDKVWTQGHPQFRWTLRGLRVYDPRKDAALGYTGEAPHVWSDRTTHEFTQNAALIRYAYTRGIYVEGRQGEADQLLVGRGLSAEEAPPARVIAAANLCDEVPAEGELRYTAAGVIRASDDFVQVEEWFAAAMAGVIVQHEGGVEIEPGHAKAAVVTITDADLVIGEPVTYSPFLPDTDGGRINTVVPRYIEPAQNWADHSGPVRRDLADIAEDGGPREETLPLPIVTSGAQADRCAEIRRRLNRLERRATITLPPRFSFLEEGDWIAWQSDRRHEGATVRYRIESWARDKGWRMRLSLREIASSVYGVPDPVEDLAETPPPPVVPDPLALNSVLVEPVVLGAPVVEGGPQVSRVPALRFTWDAPVDPAMRSIRAEVRAHGSTVVAVTLLDDLDTTSVVPLEGPSPTQSMIVTEGVGPSQLLEARLVPVGSTTRAAEATPWFTVTTAALVAGDTITIGGRPIAEIQGLDTVAPGVPASLTLASTSDINDVGDPYVRITATWTAPADLDLAGYDVEVTESGFTVVDRVATAAWSREALTGRAYAIRVRAVDLAGNVSDWTASQEIVGAGDTTAPAAPTGLSATASLGAAFLSWTNPSASDTARVRVFENTTNNSGTASALAEVNAAPGQAGGFTRSGLSSGQTRWYWVRALDTSGNLSAFSSGVSVTVPGVGTDDLDTTPPGVPAGLALSSSVANDAAGNPVVKVVATWTAVGASDLDGYELEVIEAGGPAVIRVAGTNRDEFAARSGLSYACRVRAVDRTGNRSAFSSTVSTTAAGDTTPPAAPTGLTASASLGSVFLSATAPSAADTVSLRFFENTSNNSGSAYEVARSPARPSALVTATRAGLPNATSLFYWAKAVDASGNESGFSSVATVTTPQVQVTDFASSIRPVELFPSEAAAGTPTLGRQFFNTTDFKLYRGTGSAWVRSTDGADILADSITAGQIAAGAINTTELAAGAITAEKIGALQVTAEKIAAGAISTDKLNALSVTAEKIAAGAITAEKITAGSITGDRLAANTIDATRLTLGNRMVDVGLIWTTNSPGTNQISWSAGHVAYQNDAGGLTSVGISAGTATYTGSPAWLGIWFNRTTGTINVGDVSTPAGNPADILLAVYRGGTSLTEVYGRTTIEGDYIRTGAIDARTIAAGAITTTKLAAGAVTANEIAAGAITSDRIAAGTITGDRISTSTSLPGTVTVGTTGVQIATVEARAADPLARAVSLNTTRLTPGLIEVSGSTTLADWRQAGDLTRIAGGSISANTIDANKLQIGLRGVQVAGLVFEANPDTNVVSWSAGTIVYITDAGGLAEANIASGSLTWSGGGLFDYIYWTKGGTSLQKSTSIATANTGNNVTLATYQGGRALNGTFGRTIIDGGNIRTGSVTADRLTVTSLSAISAALGTVTSGRVQNSANTTFFDLDASRQQFTVGGYVWRQGSLGSGVLCWFGPSSVGIGSETRTNGAFAFGTDGIIYYGTAPLDPGGGGDVTVTTEINQTRAGNGYNAIAGSGWQTLSSATLSVSSGQVITVTQEFGVPSTSGPTFVGEYRVREGAGTIIVAPTALSIEDGGVTDPINAQGVATASGSVTYYLEARQTSGGSLNSGNGAWAFTRFTNATSSNAGFMTPAQAEALANAAVLATTGTPANLGTAARGTATTAARSDHVHAHGDQAGGSLHANATTSVAGFMSAADKVKINDAALLSGATFTGLVSVPATLTVRAADGGNEGGEITLNGAGSNRTLQIDNFAGTLRIFDNGGGIPVYQFGGSNLTIGGNGVYHAGNYTSIPDATTSVEGLMSAADKTKLNGIAAGATANATDAALRARSSHTGTQAWSTITGAPTITTLTPSQYSEGLTAAQRDSAAQLWASAFVASGNIYYLHSDGAKRMQWNGSAIAFTHGCTAPSFTPTSDIRFKRDVTPVPDGALERVLRLDPQDFTRTGDGVAARGFIAQTLSWIDPRYVVRVRTAENQDYLAIDPVAIIADQAAAIRTLTDRLARLERLMEAVFPEAA